MAAEDTQNQEPTKDSSQDEADSSALGMSDDDFLNMDPPEESETPEDDSESQGEASDSDTGTGTDADTGTDPDKETPEADTQAQPGSEAEAGEGNNEGTTDEGNSDPQSGQTGDDSTELANSESGKAEESDPAGENKNPDGDGTDSAGQAGSQDQAIDYAGEYAKLLAPFKANGRDISVKNVDEAVKLMQMGANYNKKMQGLKPTLKIAKMLEGAELLDPNEINYLIDLKNKNPEAIRKLVKDAGINPMDLDTDAENHYVPTQRNVSDQEIELDSVLDELENSPGYSRTVEVVSKQWDEQSKQIIAKEPHLLRFLNRHVEDGIFDQISNEVQRERLFGRLTGLSDIDAYKQVGDSLHQAGKFTTKKPDSNAAGNSGSESNPNPVVIPPKQKPDDSKLNERRRAAGSSKPAAARAAPKEFNPLSMSDEEFEKFSETL